MSKGNQKKVRVMEEEENLISNLPDALLVSIISLLPYMEVVKTSVLSKRWESLWKHTTDLRFDQRQMMKSLMETYIQSSTPTSRVVKAMYRKVDPENEEYADTIGEAAMVIKSIINNHIGPLKSCSIRHLPESCASGEVVGWMRKLLEKGVIKVSIERESLTNEGIENLTLKIASSTIFFPFEVFSSFKVLELKNYYFVTTPSPTPQQILKTLTLNKVHIISNTFQDLLSHCSSLEDLTIEKCSFLRNEIKIVSPSLKYIKICNVNEPKILISAFNAEVLEIDTIFCKLEDLVFETPKLQVLRAYNEDERIGQNVFLNNGNKLLTTRDIIEIFGGILGHRGSWMESMFKNLVTLCVDFVLNSCRNAIALSFALKSFPHLMNLQINNQVKLDYYGDNDNDCLPYPGGLFWQKRDSCRCVSCNLKSVCIKGYKGGELELEFVKYLVLNAGVMDNITIWFLDDCSWDEAVATGCLRSYPQLSPKLSIYMKPGTNYTRKYGGSFDEWVRTLK